MKGYTRYFGKKLVWFTITSIVAFLLNFFLPRMMKGDPVSAIVARMAQGQSNATGVQAIYKQYTELFGTNKPWSLTTLISVAGIDLTKFIFLGFPPHKKGRETFFREIINSQYPVIYFESPHRLLKNLELLNNLAPKKNIILGRELTKMFEEIVRGRVGKVLGYFEENPEKVKGEIAIIAYC